MSLSYMNFNKENGKFNKTDTFSEDERYIYNGL